VALPCRYGNKIGVPAAGVAHVLAHRVEHVLDRRDHQLRLLAWNEVPALLGDDEAASEVSEARFSCSSGQSASRAAAGLPGDQVHERPWVRTTSGIGRSGEATAASRTCAATVRAALATGAVRRTAQT
jgi:hypothetical protein